MHRWLSRSLHAINLAFGLTLSLSTAALGNCIAHQPPNMRFTPPPDLQLRWECVTAGPLYEHTRRWYIITFKVTNAGARRTEALKMQANVVDTFGDVILTVPITDNASLGQGNSNGAVFAFHPPFSPNSVDHVNFFVLALKYADGAVWKNSVVPKSGTLAGGQVALQRFPMRWDTYDIGSEIAPSPSPYPTRSH